MICPKCHIPLTAITEPRIINAEMQSQRYGCPECNVSATIVLCVPLDWRQK